MEAVTRTPLLYVLEISALQAKLHVANANLEQSNSECVQLTEETRELKTEVDEAKAKVRHLGAENLALKRRLGSFEEGEAIPRPGPRLKPFDDLTPRQQKRASDKLQAQVNKSSEERGILPAKLSAFLTFR